MGILGYVNEHPQDSAYRHLLRILSKGTFNLQIIRLQMNKSIL